MFKNVLQIALRRLSQHKFFSLINVPGLSLGMAVFLVLVQYLRHEWSKVLQVNGGAFEGKYTLCALGGGASDWGGVGGRGRAKCASGAGKSGGCFTGGVNANVKTKKADYKMCRPQKTPKTLLTNL